MRTGSASPPSREMTVARSRASLRLSRALDRQRCERDTTHGTPEIIRGAPTDQVFSHIWDNKGLPGKSARKRQRSEILALENVD